MVSRRRRTVTLAGGLRLDCAEQGEPRDAVGRPAVVLLPGLSDSWRSFVPVLDRIPAEVWALAVSQRGHGDSDRPASDYTPEDYAADVVALLDAVSVGRAVLVGHSSSTLTARVIAAEHPERVAGLVLIGGPLTLVGHPAGTALVEVLDTLDDPVPEAFVRQFAGPTVGIDLPRDLLEDSIAEALKVPACVWRETFRALLAHDGARDLARITAPTLLVWGDEDEIVGRADQDALVAGMPDATLVVYPGVGHSPHWEAPDRFAADLADFVASLRSATG